MVQMSNWLIQCNAWVTTSVHNTKGSNFVMCKERSSKAKGTIIELCSLCKGSNFGSKQIEKFTFTLQYCVYSKISKQL